MPSLVAYIEEDLNCTSLQRVNCDFSINRKFKKKKTTLLTLTLLHFCFMVYSIAFILSFALWINHNDESIKSSTFYAEKVVKENCE